MSFLVGIDLGSGGCKVTIIDENGGLAGESFREYLTVSPHPGWAEQNPEDWLAAAGEALAEAKQRGRISAQEIAAIAVSGTTHSFVLTDSQNKILRPCILWTDIRSDREVEELLRSHGSRIFEITLHRPDVHWTLPQLLWLRKNEPQVWDKIDRLFMPKDFLRFALTGQWATDWMDGHGTLLFDVPRREWSRELCDLLGIPLIILPPAAPPQSLAGAVHAEAARRFGLCEGTPVVVGTTDQAAEAFGTGAVESGQGIIKLATAGNVAVVTDKPHPHPPMVKAYYHLNPSCWYTLKGMIFCASNYRWLRDSLCLDEKRTAETLGRSAYGLMDDLAAKIPLGCGGLIFYPHLRGINAYPFIRGCYFGITPDHGKAHFIRAVLEGVAFGIYDGVKNLEALDCRLESFRIIGGGARSALWRQILSDVTGRPLLKPHITDASFGTALLAGLGVGVFSSMEQAVKAAVRIEETITPDEDNHDRYQRLYEVYKTVEGDMQDSFRRLARTMEGF